MIPHGKIPPEDIDYWLLKATKADAIIDKRINSEVNRVRRNIANGKCYTDGTGFYQAPSIAELVRIQELTEWLKQEGNYIKCDEHGVLIDDHKILNGALIAKFPKCSAPLMWCLNH